MARHIVVPLDGSPTAELALPWAKALAERTNASIILVSVIDIPMEFGTWSVTRAAVLDQEMDTWMADTTAYLRSAGEQLGAVPFDTVVRTGGAATEVADVADRLQDPIVVMSSHGRSGVGRIFLGSVAARIVHNVQCPVLVIRQQDEESVISADALARVLVPLDGSPFAETALARAVDVLGRNLSVHLLRVVEIPAFRAGAPIEPGMSYEYGLIAEYLTAMREESLGYLQAQRELLEQQGHAVTTEVSEGRVADEILRAARERSAGVIAMATHGRGGLSRLVFGSVAERVLSDTQVPLLLIRPAE